MDVGTIELTAGRLYEEAGFDTLDAVSAPRLARALLGPGSVFTVHARSMPGDAALVRVEGKPRIYVRARLSRCRRDFALLHEVAEWHLDREGYRELDREDVADALAAALVVPRQRFLAALHENGTRFPILARRFEATESLVVLRLGEATGEPLALVAQRVRVRGDSWEWPTEQELRRLASGRAPRGLRKARLRDDPRRVVLRTA